MNPALRVLFLASEADPFVKIGGLGDVAGALPRALQEIDPSIDIRLVIPFHAAIQRQEYPLRTVTSFNVQTASEPIRAEALYIEEQGLPIYLIAGVPIVQDEPVYSSNSAQDGWKYTFFSLAALQLAKSLEWSPHILHANDWHTAPAIYSNYLNRDGFFQSMRTVLGVHNLPYLGNGTQAALTAFGLPAANDSRLPGWAQHLPLALGLLSADHIVTVSPHYAQEILTEEFGSGLDGFLKTRRDSISGILNGIDTNTWNPQTDKFLTLNYTSRELATRQGNKVALQQEFGLAQDGDRPLFSVISRMDYQKGLDLIPDAMRNLFNQDWQLIVLGTGDEAIETDFYELEDQFPDRVRTAIRFDAALSHRLYAAADVLLIPSRYEPCGLTQMIAMRYGCVPLARATGGLVDTIQDNDRSADQTGFLFQQANSVDLTNTLKRILDAYPDQDNWQQIQHTGMEKDFSWQRSAGQYLALYETLIKY